jgi:hypothetical protein
MAGPEPEESQFIADVLSAELFVGERVSPCCPCCHWWSPHADWERTSARVGPEVGWANEREETIAVEATTSTTTSDFMTDSFSGRAISVPQTCGTTHKPMLRGRL